MVVRLAKKKIKLIFSFVCVFFFKQKTAYEIKECDWSSDVCSSDLPETPLKRAAAPFVIQSQTGEIIVSFQTDEDKLQTGEQFCEAKVMTSSDNGLTWSRPTTVFSAPDGGFALWNCLLQFDKKTIFAASSVGKRGYYTVIKIKKGTRESAKNEQ